jgi:hypothetical protein
MRPDLGGGRTVALRGLQFLNSEQVHEFKGDYQCGHEEKESPQHLGSLNLNCCASGPGRFRATWLVGKNT